MVNLCFTFSETAKLFSKPAAPLYMPMSNVWGFWLLPILVNICYCVFLYQNHLSGWKVGSHCVFYLQASNGHNAYHLFLCFMAICTHPLQKGLFTSFTYFFKARWFVLWLLSCKSCYIYCRLQICRIQIYALQIFFFCSVDCLFTSFMMSYKTHFNFNKVNLLLFFC